METLVNKIIKILKAKVKQNVKEIEFLQDEINILLSEPASTFKSRELELKYSMNKELLAENEDFIQMQLQLSEFMEKFSQLFTDEEPGEADKHGADKGLNQNPDFFDKTVTGEINFGPQHPQFNDPQFFNELMEYYKVNELYEKCNELMKLKENR